MRGRGTGNTPDIVVNILIKAVEKSNITRVALAIGISHSMLHRYLKGIGEPTLTTLQKISNYSNEPFIIEIKPNNQHLVK